PRPVDHLRQDRILGRDPPVRAPPAGRRLLSQTRPRLGRRFSPVAATRLALSSPGPGVRLGGPCRRLWIPSRLCARSTWGAEASAASSWRGPRPPPRRAWGRGRAPRPRGGPAPPPPPPP